MFEVLKTFYTTHYNFGALCLLLVLLCIFFFSKKNFKGGIIVLAVVIAMNVFLYKRTEGKVWTIQIDLPPVDSGFGYKETPEPIIMKFSVHKNWTITDEKGEVHHWCWVDAYWDEFANTDIVAKIWGENSSRKMMNSTESRAGTTVDQ